MYRHLERNLTALMTFIHPEAELRSFQNNALAREVLSGVFRGEFQLHSSKRPRCFSDKERCGWGRRAGQTHSFVWRVHLQRHLRSGGLFSLIAGSGSMALSRPFGPIFRPHSEIVDSTAKLWPERVQHVGYQLGETIPCHDASLSFLILGYPIQGGGSGNLFLVNLHYCGARHYPK